MYSIIHGKDMLDADYAQLYPRVFHRECVKVIDKAWLDKVGWISGTLPPFLTFDVLCAFTQEIREKVAELMVLNNDMGLLSIDASTEKLGETILYFRLRLLYTSFGQTKSSGIKFSLPIQGGGDYSSFTFISRKFR